MLAAALAPHDGVVIWRAFVYDMKPDTIAPAQPMNNYNPLTASLLLMFATSEEWSNRLPTARAVSPIVRRDAADTGNA